MITQPSSSTPRTARRWTTPWRNMLSPSSGLTLYERFEQAIMLVLIALLAIARKFILLDLQTIAPMDVLSLAAAVLALGIVYWLVRDQDARADARIRQQGASLRKDVPDAQ